MALRLLYVEKPQTTPASLECVLNIDKIEIIYPSVNNTMVDVRVGDEYMIQVNLCLNDFLNLIEDMNDYDFIIKKVDAWGNISNY